MVRQQLYREDWPWQFLHTSKALNTKKHSNTQEIQQQIFQRISTLSLMQSSKEKKLISLSLLLPRRYNFKEIDKQEKMLTEKLKRKWWQDLKNSKNSISTNIWKIKKKCHNCKSFLKLQDMGISILFLLLLQTIKLS